MSDFKFLLIQIWAPKFKLTIDKCQAPHGRGTAPIRMLAHFSNDSATSDSMIGSNEDQ